MRARDDEQGSSSPVRYECSEQHSAWRAHEATQPMRVCVCAMRWARATMQGTSDEQDACGQRCCRATARLARPASKQNARARSDPSLGARWPAQQQTRHSTRLHAAWPAMAPCACGVWLPVACGCVCLVQRSIERGALPRGLMGLGRKPKCLVLRRLIRFDLDRKSTRLNSSHPH